MSEISEKPAGGLRLQPMLRVGSLLESIPFFESLGGRLVYGSRDGDWAQMAFGDTTLSLLAHPPTRENPEPLELQFVSEQPLEALETTVRESTPLAVVRGVADEAFGRMLQLRTPDGLLVKVLELERDLIE